MAKQTYTITETNVRNGTDLVLTICPAPIMMGGVALVQVQNLPFVIANASKDDIAKYTKDSTITLQECDPDEVATPTTTK